MQKCIVPSIYVLSKPVSQDRNKFRKDMFSLIYLMMAVIGGWVNAQGQWVKDFSYTKIVDLPLLAWNFTTTGMSWYEVGLFDDVLGTLMIIIGLIMFRRHSDMDLHLIRNYLIFLPFIIAYFAMDIVNAFLFVSFYYGNISIGVYGEIWNTVLYFGMMPMLLLASVIILSSDRTSIVGTRNV